MYAANFDAELDGRIYPLGEFEKINNIAKRLSIQCVSSSIPSHLTNLSYWICSQMQQKNFPVCHSQCMTWPGIYPKRTRCGMFVSCCVGNDMSSPSPKCST